MKKIFTANDKTAKLKTLLAFYDIDGYPYIERHKVVDGYILSGTPITESDMATLGTVLVPSLEDVRKKEYYIDGNLNALKGNSSMIYELLFCSKETLVFSVEGVFTIKDIDNRLGENGYTFKDTIVYSVSKNEKLKVHLLVRASNSLRLLPLRLPNTNQNNEVCMGTVDMSKLSFEVTEAMPQINHAFFGSRFTNEGYYAKDFYAAIENNDVKYLNDSNVAKKSTLLDKYLSKLS